MATQSLQTLTPEMIREIEAAIHEIIRKSGWGRVAIIVEKRRLTKIEQTTSAWLGRTTK